jgi:hypothetical protein
VRPIEVPQRLYDDLNDFAPGSVLDAVALLTDTGWADSADQCLQFADEKYTLAFLEELGGPAVAVKADLARSGWPADKAWWIVACRWAAYIVSAHELAKPRRR